MYNQITILRMYISLMPVIIAGVLNMIWCKSDFFEELKVPMDNGLILFDGKRLFGDNKTWKGFFGMIACGVIATIFWGSLCKVINFFEVNNYMYISYHNTLIYNLQMGLLFGAAYAIFELPNSFIKRRFDVEPGKHSQGIGGLISIIFDQADSVIGCILVLNIVYRMSFAFYIVYVLLGMFTHIIVNLFLYAFKLRRNMF